MFSGRRNLRDTVIKYAVENTNLEEKNLRDLSDKDLLDTIITELPVLSFLTVDILSSDLQSFMPNELNLRSSAPYSSGSSDSAMTATPPPKRFGG